MQDFYKSEVVLLNTMDVDHWLAALRQIRDSGLSAPESKLNARFDRSLTSYMLENDWYGYSGIDLYVPLRLALKTCTNSDTFIYHLADLVLSEYSSADDDFVSIATGFISGEHTANSKIIVLTEGKTDRWIISESIKLLHPHLLDYFTFMDFEAARVEGGAGALAGMVKSFAGAGIVNKVVAVFDSDTAGESAIRTLRQIRLSENIRVMQLPPLEALTNYPTIGPAGTTAMDINGMAASIELYLGADVFVLPQLELERAFFR